MLKKNIYIFFIFFIIFSSVYIYTKKNFYHEINIDLSLNSKIESKNIDLQLFYILNDKNKNFKEDFSLSKSIETKSNQDLSIDFNIDNLRIKNKLDLFRLDLGNASNVQFTIHSIKVNGDEIIQRDYKFHDVSLVSRDNDELVLMTTGSDPFIYTEISFSPKLDYYCIVYLVVIFVLVLLAILAIKLKVWKFLQNKYGYIFCPILFSIILFVITSNYTYIFPFILEWVLFVLCLDLFCNYNVLRKILSLLILIVLGMQASSIANTGDYLVVLTLENLGEYRSVGVNVIRLSFVIGMAYILMGINISNDKLVKISLNTRILLIIFAGILVCVANSFNYKSPFISFTQTIKDFVKLKMISTDNVIKEEQKFIYGKDKIVYDNLVVESDKSLKGKNVIVLFSEGVSADLFGKNNGRNDLTPNIDKLITKSLYLDNYYNHTAATFRGLRGQLSSSYQLVGGYYNDNSGIGQLSEQELQKRYSDTIIGIPQILKENGYHSYFVVSHSKNHNLAYMLKTLFFDRVFGAEDYLKEDQKRELSDQELFTFINQLIDSKLLIEPYFIGVYNLDTHLGKDSADLKYQDGNNALLNTVANYDNAVSKLIAKFNDESFAKNNVLIITADHATYPSTMYKETIDDNAKYFVNKIPFIVYTYGIKPQVIDVKGLNSLSFAPTLLHMLGISKGKNYFLGCSIFDKKCKSDFKYITNIGSETFETKDSKITVSTDKILEKKIYNFYNLSN